MSDCNIPKGSRLPDTENETVFYRILKFHLNVTTKKEINEYNKFQQTFQPMNMNEINVQSNLFKPLRKLNGSYEQGISVDWSRCSTPEESVQRNTTRHLDEAFGVLEIKVKNIHLTKYNQDFLNTQYYPDTNNVSHSLILGFPTKEEVEKSEQSSLAFTALRQRMSIIAEWKLLPRL
jgi:hypothetical protein